MRDLFGLLQSVREAFIIAIAPPTIRRIGTSGGFKMQIQTIEGSDMGPALAAARQIMAAAQSSIGVVPLMITTGPGAELCQTLGTKLFFGMSGVTFMSLVFTLVSNVAPRRLSYEVGSMTWLASATACWARTVLPSKAAALKFTALRDSQSLADQVNVQSAPRTARSYP